MTRPFRHPSFRNTGMAKGVHCFMAKTVRFPKPLPTWEAALEQFLLWQQAARKRPATVGDYRQKITQFFTRHPEVWGREDRLREAALSFVAEPGIAAATYNLRLVYLRNFFNWCREQGYVAANPLAGLKRQRAEGRTVVLEEESLCRLLEQPDQGTFAGLRDFTLLLLQLDTGIRPSEAFRLLPSAWRRLSCSTFSKWSVTAVRPSGLKTFSRSAVRTTASR